MKKYRCYYLNDFRDDYDASFEEDEDGDWYRVEDVDAHLEKKRKRVEDLEHMLHRCEMWLSTHPEAKKMQEAVKQVLMPKE